MTINDLIIANWHKEWIKEINRCGLSDDQKHFYTFQCHLGYFTVYLLEEECISYRAYETEIPRCTKNIHFLSDFEIINSVMPINFAFIASEHILDAFFLPFLNFSFYVLRKNIFNYWEHHKIFLLKHSVFSHIKSIFYLHNQMHQICTIYEILKCLTMLSNT